MGDCPQSVLDAFDDWVLDGSPSMAIIDGDAGPVRLSWHALCSRVRDCDEPLPDDLCEWLDLPHGTSYGSAAAQLLEDAPQPPPIRHTGLDADGVVRGWTGTEWVRLS